MMNRSRMGRWLGMALLVGLGVAGGLGAAESALMPTAAADEAPAMSPQDQVVLGRAVVLRQDCGGCHGGMADPGSEAWLSGYRGPVQMFKIGPCAVDPSAEPCFRTYPRNLTPDNLTGIGRFSERQIFNALRYGLRPGETPDVEITSTTPGQGNFPMNPKYLAPPMPWPAFRHMSDEELWAIAAYLKRGLRPVSNRVPDSEGPPDFWSSAYTPDQIGSYPAPAFPTVRETVPE